MKKPNRVLSSSTPHLRLKRTQMNQMSGTFAENIERADRYSLTKSIPQPVGMKARMHTKMSCTVI
ncbi:hypothetical protein OIU84_023417 [Salix udensis]|uniref:Uncharacterized protein n=1 Tax=Salix udensis TaxID=889485 RepID=A0AAD6KT20_9ROSI|nr:hypothetical protein OIU84_023417 [Salix udensis]